MVVPERQIRTDEDLQKFLSTRQFAELWTFILRLNAAVRGKKGSIVSAQSASKAVKEVLNLLDELQKWVDEIPPLESETRFGNKAFRTWHTRLVSNTSKILQPVIATRGQCKDKGGWPVSDGEICEEVGAYLCCAFGDATRIDYGSGHEAMFAVVLYCLRNCGVFDEGDEAALVLLVFRRYLRVSRTLQLKYMLEPAGSHGVWGLDDYSFLPFLWGSSQLLETGRISPRVVDDDRGLAEHRSEYLYVDAIAFIKDMKSGPFHEHSPMLFDISRVPGGWAKINQGMIRMYQGEVWGKRVVIQHFLFGKIFQFDKDSAAKTGTTVGGAKVPSSSQKEAPSST